MFAVEVLSPVTDSRDAFRAGTDLIPFEWEEEVHYVDSEEYSVVEGLWWISSKAYKDV